jgi:hypothetical protein
MVVEVFVLQSFVKDKNLAKTGSVFQDVVLTATTRNLADSKMTGVEENVQSPPVIPTSKDV